MHLRRKFYELATAGPEWIASEALMRVAAFYTIENLSVAAAQRSIAWLAAEEPDAFEGWPKPSDTSFTLARLNALHQ